MNILSPKKSNSFAPCKYGEIFFQSNEDFLIYCSVCEMVCTEFAEFLRHVQTSHFADAMTAQVNVITGDIDTKETETEGIINKKSTCDEETINVDNQLEDTGECKEHFDESAGRYVKPTAHDKFLPAMNEHIFDGQDTGSEKLKPKHPDGNLLISCHECDESFPDSRSLHRHCVQQHCGFKCSLCERRFQQFHQCKRHEETHIATKTYTCPFQGCSKSFTEKYYLRRHQDVHNTERSFRCDFENCGKAFHTNRRLLAHRKIHTKPKNLICDICGYSCRENETLRVHQRIHTGERPYPCQICSKRFISSSSLGEHMASHASGRPHVCKVCNAAFARQKALYHHRFLHLDVKQFKCYICGSAYKQAAGLAGHMRKHRQERHRLTSAITTAIAAST